MWVIPGLVCLKILHMLHQAAKLKPEIVAAIIKALLWNIHALPDTLRKRHVVQRFRVVPDSEIQHWMARGSLELAIGLGLRKHPVVKKLSVLRAEEQAKKPFGTGA